MNARNVFRIAALILAAAASLVLIREVSGDSPERVERYGMVIGIKPEKIEQYRKLHAAAWPAVLAKIRECHIRNYSIYLREVEKGQFLLFSYFEYTGGDFEADMEIDGFNPDTGAGLLRTTDGRPDIERYLKRDLPKVREQDCIILLPGWQQSEGTCRELFEAYGAGHHAFELIFTTDGCQILHVDRTRVDVLAALPRAAIASGIKDPVPAYDELGHYDYPGPTGPGGTPAQELPEKTLAEKIQIAIAARLAPSPTDEVRVVDPKTGGEKGEKIDRYDLLPAEPLRQVAHHYGVGARKYACRNWERGYRWSLSFGAMMRHAWQFWAGEDDDKETGSPHLAAVVFHALAMMEFRKTHPELDDRPGKNKEV
jgi:hypothetical protein